MQVEVEQNPHDGGSAVITEHLRRKIGKINLSVELAYRQLLELYMEVTAVRPNVVIHLQPPPDQITFQKIGQGWRIINYESEFWPGLIERLTQSDLCSQVHAQVVYPDPSKPRDGRDVIYFEVAGEDPNPLEQLVLLRPVILGG